MSNWSPDQLRRPGDEASVEQRRSGGAAMLLLRWMRPEAGLLGNRRAEHREALERVACLVDAGRLDDDSILP